MPQSLSFPSSEYAAGFFDGEGSVGMWRRGGYSRQGYHARLALAHTHLPTLEALRDRWGGKILLVPSARTHHKQAWRWNLSKRADLAQFLEDILPHLIEKQDRTLNVWMALAGLRDYDHARNVHQRLMEGTS